MMSQQLTRRAVAAAVVVLMLVAGAVWIAVSERGESFETTLLLPDFAGQLTAAQKVLVHTAGDGVAVELVRNGDNWSVMQRDGYPADVGKIGVLLQDLAELTVLEPKTATAESYPAIGVEDVTAAGAQGVRVEVLGAGDEPLVDLIVGKAAAGMQATYVRKTGEAQSWLTGRLDVSRNPAAWLAKMVAHVDTDRIHQAALRISGKPAVTFTKAARGTGDFAASGLPANRRLSRPSAANGIAAALIAVENEDVRRSDTLKDISPAARATYRTFDGLVIEVTGWTQGDERWISLATSFDAGLASRFADDKPADNTGAAIWRTPEQVQQEVERVNNRVGGWAFRIQAYKYEGIFPDVDRWLEG